MIAPLQNTVSATKNFLKVFTTLMITGDATQKHRNVQAAVNALALKDRDQCVLFEEMFFRFSATPSPFEWYTKMSNEIS